MIKSHLGLVSKMDSPLMPRYPFLPNCFVGVFHEFDYPTRIKLKKFIITRKSSSDP